MTAGDRSASRREALGRLLRLSGTSAAVAGGAVWLRSRSRRPEEVAAGAARPDFRVPPDARLPELVVARGGEPEGLVRRAMEELGGMERFVTRGDVVAIKPNIAWDRAPEQAANTNPDVVAETVRLCLAAGAARVIVTDVSCNDPRRCFRRSGIGEGARRAGAEVILPERQKFKKVDLGGDVLGQHLVFTPLIEADKVINIPIAKQHSLTRVTLGMKNWYGILGGLRHRLHQHIHESIVDLADFMRPTLTLLDAYRVLLRGGPTGGNLEDVALRKTLIAGTDAAAVDAYAAKTYWNIEPEELRYLELARARGLGNPDFRSVRTRFVTL